MYMYQCVYVRQKLIVYASVCVTQLHKTFVCEGVAYVQVHVTGKCEAITGFDRVKSFGGADDVLFLSSYGVTTEFSTVDSY